MPREHSVTVKPLPKSFIGASLSLALILLMGKLRLAEVGDLSREMESLTSRRVSVGRHCQLI